MILDKLLAHISYSMQIDEHLFARLKNHLIVLKHLGKKKHTHQEWIVSSIKENLEQEILPSSLKPHHLRFLIDTELNEKIKFKVELMKKFRRHYSKKQLILEAIYKKLDEEEEEAKKLLQNKLSKKILVD